MLESRLVSRIARRVQGHALFFPAASAYAAFALPASIASMLGLVPGEARLRALPAGRFLTAIGIFALQIVPLQMALVPLLRLRLPSDHDGLRRLDRNSGILHRPATAVAAPPSHLIVAVTTCADSGASFPSHGPSAAVTALRARSRPEESRRSISERNGEPRTKP